MCSRSRRTAGRPLAYSRRRARSRARSKRLGRRSSPTPKSPSAPSRISKLLHVDRAGNPSVSSFFNTDDTKEEYNASEPVNDRKRWLDQFVHLMGHTGNYTREEAIAAIDKEGTLPDVLSFDPSKPAKYPNGR